jgi:oligopeptide transport system substrate-binding protein
MTKKLILLVLTLFLAFGIAACGGDDTVVDEENPVISGMRDVTYVIDQSATPNFSEGVTAFDNLDGNITSKLAVDATAVDLTTPGSYTVTYTVSDLSGNEATESITVTVSDLTAPTIAGITGMTYVISTATVDPNYLDGVTASDNVDGDLTADIVVDYSAVDLAVEGLYEVTYVVEDGAGNSSPVYTAYLQVKQYPEDADAVPPVITGQVNVSYVIGISATPDYATGVVATDNLDGDVPVTFDDSAVDLTTPGVYIVTYSAEDSVENEGTAQITVTVSLETEAPVISGIRILEVYQGGVPNYLLGLEVSDNVSVLTLADIVVDASAVDINVAGRYDVIFTLTDEAGNMVTEETEIIVAVNPINLTPDLNATYRTSTSGTDNLNPYSETLATASTLYGWITDGLYTGDYDFEAARDILVADGVTGLPAEIGFDEWYAAGYHAEDLPYNRYAAMAADLPVDVNGDGLVWEITLRTDLEFEDGTAIDASTFDYSWSQLLDPKLLNDRASNLYDATNLPIVNAEAYVKQLSYQTDAFDYDLYEDDTTGVIYTRENAYAFDDLGGNGWPMYFLDQTIDLVYTGADLIPGDTVDETLPYLEDWGGGDFVLEDAYANAFMWTADNVLVAPSEGWELDGVAVGTSATLTGAAWARGFDPAYMDDAGNFATLDAEGLPANSSRLTQDAVAWNEVGFAVTDTYTFQITLAAAKTQWDVMGNLMGGSTGVVHEAAFEAGMNVGETSTNYGTIDNPLVSYGPFNMTAWESEVLYFYTLNEDHYSASDFRITKLRYDVIEDQSIVIDEFKAGRLDVAGAGGQYYDEFKYSLNLKLSPVTTFFRFAFNIAGSDAYELNPILTQAEFRQAFFFAIDRDTFATEVRDPSVPTYGFLGPVYYSTEYNSYSYRSSVAGNDVLADWSPSTFGYDPVQAKTLFDTAYAAAVAAGDIQDGEMVSVEYKFYDVETNWQVAEWVEDTVEAIFNTGEATPKFDLELSAVSSAALNDAWDNGDFEMTFGGWTGLDFDAPSMLGQVYNSSKAYMLEVGFDTENAEITATLPNTKVALQAWTDEFEADFPEYIALYDAYMLITDPTEQQTTDYEAAVEALTDPQTPTDNAIATYESWEAVLALFVGDDLTCTYDDLFNYAYGEFYNVNDVNYDGKDDDFDEITATLEAELLNQMIAIPLFSSVNTAVYSTRVVFEADTYHARMAWGGMKYMYIGTESE